MAGSRAEVGSAAALFRLMQDVQQMLPFAGRRGQSVGPPWLHGRRVSTVSLIREAVSSRLAPVTVTRLSRCCCFRAFITDSMSLPRVTSVRPAQSEMSDYNLQLVIISVSFTYPRLVYPFTLAYAVVISLTISSPDAHQNKKICLCSVTDVHC